MRPSSSVHPTRPAALLIAALCFSASRFVRVNRRSVMRHMENGKVTIAVILDSEIGDGLRKFSEGMPVWITSSPTNEKAVRNYWKDASSNRYDVTFWSEPRIGATEDEWLGILDDLELHHSED